MGMLWRRYLCWLKLFSLLQLARKIVDYKIVINVSFLWGLFCSATHIDGLHF